MNDYYDGKLLVAPPSMRDPRFAKSVVFIWKHDVSGAAGVIINRPLNSPNFKEVCAEANVISAQGVNPTMFYGGPVIEGIIGCLHSNEYNLLDTVGAQGPVSFTLDRQVINDVALDCGPKNYILTVGMSSWESGQLEEELESIPPRSKNESWLILDCDPNLIWQGNHPNMWNACVNLAVAQHSREFTSKLLRD